jgi:hypothetical protein
MLRIPGKAGPIEVRKVLWTCAELGMAGDRIELVAAASEMPRIRNGIA